MDGSGRIAHNHLMTGAPPPDGRPSQPPAAGRSNTKRSFDLKTIIAITVAGVVLIGVALCLAYISASCPTVGSYLLVVGVVAKGVASLMEGIMKTEDDGFWRSEPKRATAWLNVIAMLLAFPALFAKAVAADLVTF